MPDGSLSLCQPSENLRKLVPEEVFNFNAAMQSYSKLASTLLPSNNPMENLDVKNENENDVDEQLSDVDNQEEFVIISKIGDSRNATVDISLATANELAKRNTSNLIDMPNLLTRPTLMFCLQSHNLEKLRYAMKRNLRIATCRIFALQALNWFIRSVTSVTCLHDLMWWFVSALYPTNDDEISKYDEALEHPMTSIKMCDKISSLLTQSFHAFLQSVADLTLLLPSGSALQQLAIQCFGIKFHQNDHHFLHQSHVFGNISKILSRSDELREHQTDDVPFIFGDVNVLINSHGSVGGTKFHTLFDMSGMFEVSVSSRAAMASALTDSSTETFWESDEDDRNKSKTIEISLNKFDYSCKMVAIHIDNTRDLQNKVTNVVFYGGQSLGDTNLIKSYDIDSRTGSWISANVTGKSANHKNPWNYY